MDNRHAWHGGAVGDSWTTLAFALLPAHGPESGGPGMWARRLRRQPAAPAQWAAPTTGAPHGIRDLCLECGAANLSGSSREAGKLADKRDDARLIRGCGRSLGAADGGRTTHLAVCVSAFPDVIAGLLSPGARVLEIGSGWGEHSSIGASSRLPPSPRRAHPRTARVRRATCTRLPER